MSALSSAGSGTLAVPTLRPFAFLLSWEARMRSHAAYTSAVDSPPLANASTQWNVPEVSTGVTCSPRPIPIAVPPSRPNATSLPMPDASSHSSFWLRPVPHSSLHATRVAAASALPPARPAATGIRLVIWIASPGASREPGPTARASALGGSGGKVAAIRRHAVGPFTGDGHAVALRRGDGHLIEQRDRVIHRRHVVVAVGPDRAHGKLEIHLRRDTHGHSGNRAHDAPMVAAWAYAPES